jgi:hypothetical protein
MSQWLHAPGHGYYYDMSQWLHAPGHGYYYESAACGLTVAMTATATLFACRMPRCMSSQGYVGRSNLNYT